MPTTNPLLYQAALEDFRRLRRQALLRRAMLRLTGQSNKLLAFKDVERYLEPTEQVHHGLREISVDAIVGSVGRFQDFTRDFLPKRDSDAERWARVKSAVLNAQPMPPIDVYQVGGVYFVKDGNHRVSVARQLGTKTLTAHVTEVQTRVPLTPDDDPTRAICKARYADFLAQTKLDETRPEADLLMTYCGEYDTFLRQIATHHGWLQMQRRGLVADADAAADWYDRVYLPVVQILRERGAPRLFPDCTEADLYILLLRQMNQLHDELGWHMDTEAAVAALTQPQKSLRQRLLGAVIPESLEDGPDPGQWRQQREGQRDQLFRTILVPVRESDADRHLVDRAIAIARQESGRLLGLHVVAEETEISSAPAQAVAANFSARCHAAGVPHDFAFEAGSVADAIVTRAAWADLAMTSLAPAEDARFQDPVSTRLVRRSPCPVLTIPQQYRSPLQMGLLAYDGSPKAGEALFTAVYLALRWEISLTVVTVETSHTSPEMSQRARTYLEKHGVVADYVVKAGDIAAVVLETAVAHDVNLIIMGGFGFRPMLQLMLGSTVNALLRTSPVPLLICR